MLAGAQLANAETKARVVVAQDPQAIQQFDAQKERVYQLAERSILALTGKQKISEAWQSFAGPDDIVGIKIAARGGPLFSVHKDLVAAIVAGLKSAGIPESHIVIWDKYQSDLVEAGYTIHESPDGVRVVGVIPSIGFDPNVKYRSPIAGKIIWGDYSFGKQEEISGDSHLARIVTQQLTKIINIAMLSDHSELGLSGCLWNAAMGSVDNVRRFQNDPAACESAVAEILSMRALHDKLALHIIDGLLGQYALGPNFHPQFTWHHGCIYFGTDPVAVDTIALEEIESQRRRAGLAPIGKRAQYIQTAAAAGLGIATREQIEVISVGTK